MPELTIVYEGPGLAGKTTSIEQVARMLEGAMYRLDFPQQSVLIPSFVITAGSLTLIAKAVAGAAYYVDARTAFRAEADAFVLVADSAPERRDANEETRDNIVGAFAPGAMPPVVLQLNKRDLPTPAGITTLARLFPDAPRFQSIAPKCIGVWEAFAAAALLAAERRDVVPEVRELLERRRT